MNSEANYPGRHSHPVGDLVAESVVVTTMRTHLLGVCNSAAGRRNMMSKSQ